MRIGTSFYLFSNSMVLASRLYFRERSSTLYTVITAGEAVKVSSYAAGRVASCRLATARQRGVGSAAGEAAEVKWQCGASIRW